MDYPHWVDRDSNLREVAPRLFVGSELAPAHGGFDLVVALVDQDRRDYVGNALVRVYAIPDCVSLPLVMLDRIFDGVRPLLVRRGRVLVHCQAGLSRSASVAYGLLRTIYMLSHEEALRRVQVPGHEGRHPCAPTLDSVQRWADGRMARRGR